MIIWRKRLLYLVLCLLVVIGFRLVGLDYSQWGWWILALPMATFMAFYLKI